MTLGIEVLDIGLGYIREGLEFVREILMKIANFVPIGNPELIVTIVFLLASLWIGHFIVKRFVTRPWSGGYVLWYLIISISIFLNLMYF